MEDKGRHMLEAITMLQEKEDQVNIPKWYVWLDRILACGLYIGMAYIYLTLLLWLIKGS